MQNANEDGGGAVGFALTSGEDCRLLPVGGPYVAALEDTHATDEFPGLLTSSEPFNPSELNMNRLHSDRIRIHHNWLTQF